VSSLAVPHRSWNPWVTLAAGAAIAGGAVALSAGEGTGWRMGALLVLGAALGVTLYHALFGFTSAWRAFVAERRGAGLRAQMVMLAVATLLFLPALAEGEMFGRSIVGAVAPIGVSLLVGAFLFGLGMQLGGGCASGTLYTAGGGNPRMLVTLTFFVAGSVFATAHVPWWFSRPDLGSVSLLTRFGLAGALAAQLTAFAVIATATVVLERRRHGHLGTAAAPERRGLRRLLQGPWPLVMAAVLLALFNWCTLALAGHPWGVTYGFTLWGAKIATTMGFDLSSWEFWTWGHNRWALAGSVFANSTSVMNMGVMLGALLAAGAAGRFAPRVRIPLRSLLAAALGGLLMGYGARLSFGCNIGAYFGGIASASLHGWVWFLVAMAGTVLGTRFRPWFGLGVERG